MTKNQATEARQTETNARKAPPAVARESRARRFASSTVGGCLCPPKEIKEPLEFELMASEHAASAYAIADLIELAACSEYGLEPNSVEWAAVAIKHHLELAMAYVHDRMLVEGGA